MTVSLFEIRLFSAGARVVIADLNGAGAQSVASTLPAAFGIGVDVSDEAAVQRVVDETVAKYGRVDILVSNAGFQHIAAVEEFPYNVFRKMMDVHVGGAPMNPALCFAIHIHMGFLEFLDFYSITRLHCFSSTLHGQAPFCLRARACRR